MSKLINDDEAPWELYDVTYEILTTLGIPGPALVLMVSDNLRAYMQFMDDEENSTIRITITPDEFISVARIKEICKEASPVDMYIKLIRNNTELVFEDDAVPMAVMYLILLLHEIGHLQHGTLLCTHGYNIQKLKDATSLSISNKTLPNILKYSLDPFELYADAFVCEHYKLIHELYYDKVAAIFTN